MSPDAVVDLIVQADIDAPRCYALQRHLLNLVAEGRRGPVLLVYMPAGDGVSLGRFHVAPSRRHAGVYRRFAGGRVLPFGPGHVGVGLILPQRDSLTGALPGSLSAPQVMNRHVRGFLHACRGRGVDPIYPGRDVVTIRRRIVASLSLEVEVSGVSLFELTIARSQSFGGVAERLAEIDSEGVVAAGLLGADEASDLATELEGSLGFTELVELLRMGFSRQLGAAVEPARMSATDEETIAAIAAQEREGGNWAFGRRRPQSASFRGSHIGAGGLLDVYFEERRGLLREVVVSGDFISGSDTVKRLESSLDGCRRDPQAIDRAIAVACSRPGDFLLGVDPPTAVRDAIMRGAPC